MSIEPKDTLEDWEFEPGGRINGFSQQRQERITTSPITARNPDQNLVQTRSGSVYQLGNHGGQGYAPEVMWDDDGWRDLGNGPTPIPRIQES